MVNEKEINNEIAQFTLVGFTPMEFDSTNPTTGAKEHIVGTQCFMLLPASNDGITFGCKCASKFIPGKNEWKLGAKYEPKIAVTVVKGKIEAKIVGYQLIH